MLKFIHVTDPHLVAPGVPLHGLDPAARLGQCVTTIASRHPDAAFCALTGDVADAGEPAAYAFARDAFGRLSMPLYPIPGNHDDRAAMVAAFPDLARDEDGFVQYAVEHGDAVFLMLDTLEPARGSGGAYCARRAAWLDARLAHAGDRPVYVFMHHPPFAVGMPAHDVIGLEDVEPFARTVAAHGNVRHIFFGHVHRPVSGHWRGISFSTLYGTSHQCRLDLEPAGPIRYTAEPPAYCVVLIDGDRLAVHTDHFLADTTDIRDGAAAPGQTA